jgi:hypothetical protein
MSIYHTYSGIKKIIMSFTDGRELLLIDLSQSYSDIVWGTERRKKGTPGTEGTLETGSGQNQPEEISCSRQCCIFGNYREGFSGRKFGFGDLFTDWECNAEKEKEMLKKDWRKKILQVLQKKRCWGISGFAGHEFAVMLKRDAEKYREEIGCSRLQRKSDSQSYVKNRKISIHGFITERRKKRTPGTEGTLVPGSGQVDRKESDISPFSPSSKIMWKNWTKLIPSSQVLQKKLCRRIRKFTGYGITGVLRKRCLGILEFTGWKFTGVIQKERCWRIMDEFTEVLQKKKCWIREFTGILQKRCRRIREFTRVLQKKRFAEDLQKICKIFHKKKDKTLLLSELLIIIVTRIIMVNRIINNGYRRYKNRRCNTQFKNTKAFNAS